MITQRIPHVILLHIYVLLEYNCFTVLVVLLYKVNQLNVYIYPLPLEPPTPSILDNSDNMIHCCPHPTPI